MDIFLPSLLDFTERYLDSMQKRCSS